MLKKSAWFAVVPCAVLLGCATEPPPSQTAAQPAPPPRIIQTIQPGDGNLDCAGLVQQMGEMDQIMYGTEPPSTTTTVGGQAAAGALSMLPFGGSVAGGAVGSATSASSRQTAYRQQQTVAMAQRRRQFLMGLYQKKKCS